MRTAQLRIFFISLLIFPLALSGRPALAESEFVIIERGFFHGGEAPARGGDGWLALIEKDGGWSLEETSIQVKRVPDVLFDDDDDFPTGLEIRCRDYPEALVLLNHPALKAGPIKLPDGGARPLKSPAGEDESDPRQYPMSRLVRSFAFSGRLYWLELFTNIYGIAPDEIYSDAYTAVDRLFPHAAKPDRPSMLIPQHKPKINWSDPNGTRHSLMEKNSRIEDVWAGDLDGDDHPDLIVWNDGYNHHGVCLHLSSVAMPALGRTPPIRRVGCQIATGD